MDLLLSNPALSLIAIGFFLLAIEVVVLGFSTFILFFVGVSLILTGGLVYLDIVGSSVFEVAVANGVLIPLLAILLWKPMRNYQNEVDNTPVVNDMVGCIFVLSVPISVGVPIKYRYSGLLWDVVSKEDISVGTKNLSTLRGALV